MFLYRIASLNFDRETDIEWSSLVDEAWNVWNHHKLQQSWRSLKETVVSEGTTHRGERTAFSI